MTETPTTQFKLLLPTSLKNRIEAAARRHERSISGEIIATLRQAFPEPYTDEERRAFVHYTAYMYADGRGPIRSEGDRRRVEDLLRRYLARSLQEPSADEVLAAMQIAAPDHDVPVDRLIRWQNEELFGNVDW